MPHRPVVVAVNGSAADLPALAWATEEASTTGRPLLITHAAGHLPPHLTYAERHVAREQRHRRGQGVVERAAHWVRDQAPGVPLQTMVRLLDSAVMLPVVSPDAYAMTQAGDGWVRTGADRRRAPVVAVADGPADRSTLEFATGYADRRGVELVVLDGHGPGVARWLLERGAADSLVVLPRPERDPRGARFSWQVVMEIFARSRSPVALVAEPADVAY